MVQICLSLSLSSSLCLSLSFQWCSSVLSNLLNTTFWDWEKAIPSHRQQCGEATEHACARRAGVGERREGGSGRTNTSQVPAHSAQTWVSKSNKLILFPPLKKVLQWTARRNKSRLFPLCYHSRYSSHCYPWNNPEYWTWHCWRNTGGKKKQIQWKAKQKQMTGMSLVYFPEINEQVMTPSNRRLLPNYTLYILHNL